MRKYYVGCFSYFDRYDFDGLEIIAAYPVIHVSYDQAEEGQAPNWQIFRISMN